MNQTKVVNILLIDDHKIFREGVKRVVEMVDNFRVIGEGANGEEAIELVEKLKPDVVLLDINMPDMNGVEATEEILRVSPQSKLIILSIHDEEAYVYKALQQGASGYLLKEMDVDSLIEALKVVSEGGAYVHPKVTGKLIDEFRRLRTASEQHGLPTTDHSGW